MKFLIFLVLGLCLQSQSAFAEARYIEFDIANIAFIDGVPKIAVTKKSVRAKLEDLRGDGTLIADADEKVEFKMPNGDASLFVQFRFIAITGKEASGRYSATYSSGLSGEGVVSESGLNSPSRLRSLSALLSTMTSAKYEYLNAGGQKVVVDLRTDVENFRVTK